MRTRAGPGGRRGRGALSEARLQTHLDTWLAILGFAAVTAFTPGPNNMMLMISGANFGFVRSIPHCLGITFGFPLMVLAVALGLGGVLLAEPMLHRVLTWVAFAYLCWLAWKLAHAGRVDAAGVKVGTPMSFLSAALFQWVNPKAWIMAVGATALYMLPGEPPLVAAGRLALAFFLMAIASTVVWCLFGTVIARVLSSDRHVTIFNMAMAVLLVVSMLPTLV
ncbi:MAG: LysE family translocator [Bosea sp.]|nr:LysE family translocator [Bosea sp. (in: a-proteobacteria)]